MRLRLCPCLCVCVYACVHALLYVKIKARGTHGSLSPLLSTVFFEMSLAESGAEQFVELVAQLAPGAFCL